MRLEEETDLGNGRRVAEERGVLGDCLQVEELDRCERSPDLLDAAAEVGSIEQVDERAFEPGDGDVETGPMWTKTSSI